MRSATAIARDVNQQQEPTLNSISSSWKSVKSLHVFCTRPEPYEAQLMINLLNVSCNAVSTLSAKRPWPISKSFLLFTRKNTNDEADLLHDGRTKKNIFLLDPYFVTCHHNTSSLFGHTIGCWTTFQVSISKRTKRKWKWKQASPLKAQKAGISHSHVEQIAAAAAAKQLFLRENVKKCRREYLRLCRSTFISAQKIWSNIEFSTMLRIFNHAQNFQSCSDFLSKIEKSLQSLEFLVKLKNFQYIVVIYSWDLSITISEHD